MSVDFSLFIYIGFSPCLVINNDSARFGKSEGDEVSLVSAASHPVLFSFRMTS